jgi:hypothetical protein
MGRHMHDTAVCLVEEVLPVVPVRQWVLSFPYELRYRFAWDAQLLSNRAGRRVSGGGCRQPGLPWYGVAIGGQSQLPHVKLANLFRSFGG